MKKLLQKVSMGLMKLIAMSTPSCEVIGKKISESFERSLTLKERVEIKIHLLGCKFCMRYRDQLIKLHQMASKLADDFEVEEQHKITLDNKIKLQIKELIIKQKNSS